MRVGQVREEEIMGGEKETNVEMGRSNQSAGKDSQDVSLLVLTLLTYYFF